MSDQRISMSEIADRIGVTLPAVSNWRRRHLSFPPGEKSGDTELFSVREISNWLNGRKISTKNLRPGELPGTTYGTRFSRATGNTDSPNEIIDVSLWKMLLPLQGAEDIAGFSDLVLGLLYLALSDGLRWNEIVTAKGSRRLALVDLASSDQDPLLKDFPHAHDVFLDDPRSEIRIGEVVQLVDRIRQSGRGAEVFEFLLDQFAEVEGRRGATVHTPSAIIRLVVELAAPGSEASVLDPCCGSGGFLVYGAKYIAATNGNAANASFTGYALSKRSASLARMNLRLHDVPAHVDARTDIIFGGEAPNESRRFTVIMSNPPFDIKGPVRSPLMPDPYGYDSLARKRSSYAWLQYVMSSMADDGRAAVVMPGGALFREGFEKQIRAQMINDGIIEAVVALPPALFTSTGIPVTIWLLRKQMEPRRNNILLIDASDLGYMMSRTQRNLSNEDITRVVSAVMKWRTGDGYEDVRGFSASVTVGQISKEDYVLTPARYVGHNASPEMPVSTVRKLRDDLSSLEQRVGRLDNVVNRQLDRIYPWIR